MAKFCPRFPAFTCNVFWDVLVPLLIDITYISPRFQMTYLVSIDIFMCGVATLLQLKRTPLTESACPLSSVAQFKLLPPRNNWWKARNHLYVWDVIAAGIFVFLIAGFLPA